ncbi:protein NYNRIN-like [Limulus polyphemus]|uniref:Protein NYNRIN-like n=1 Tax=Limulus polyphemus TaxID=6850 RepID=A0ABM1TGU7_LIMPO|nr:protein NYNRIN-like [Limulus polyphemus]
MPNASTSEAKDQPSEYESIDFLLKCSDTWQSRRSENKKSLKESQGIVLYRKTLNLAEVIKISEQKKDPDINDLRSKVTQGDETEYMLDSDVLCRKVKDSRTLQIVIPVKLRIKVMKTYHDTPFAAHLAFAKTYSRISRRFFWLNMRKDIKEYCESCLECQGQKSSPHLRNTPLQRMPTLTTPFQLVAMGILGPLPTSYAGNK